MKDISILHSFVLLLLLSFWLCSCSTYRTVTPDIKKETLITAQTEIPVSELLDVRIQIFDPGKLPTSVNASRGLSEEIREAESHFIAVQLKNALQQTGHWGAVRVVPEATLGNEVLVTGCIMKSNGEVLKLKVSATDATGRRWFKNKVFKGAVSDKMYKEAADDQIEVFQNVYNHIVNDLSIYRMTMTPKQVQEVRHVAEMRFAEGLAPSAFAGYLQREKGKSCIKIDRLPSKDDEMMERVRRVRERDYVLVDTLDAQFEGLHRKMGDAYTDWRKTRLDEMNMIRKVDARRNAERMKGVLGASIGAACGQASQSTGYYNPMEPAVVGVTAGAGITMMIEAEQISEESEINKVALEEIGVSFVADVQPTVLEVEGETIKLTGSANAKYQKWREVLASLCKVESQGLGTLQIESEPEGADVWLYGEMVGQTPSQAEPLGPEYGFVFIFSQPADAQLTVDGSKVKGPASQRLRLTTLPHRIDVSKAGYELFSTTLTPTVNVSKKLNVQLKKDREVRDGNIQLENETEYNKGEALPNVTREQTLEELAALLKIRLKEIEPDFDRIIANHLLAEKSAAGEISEFEQPELEAEPGAGPGVEKQGKLPEYKIEDTGDDDDVVARQLREVAESETDKKLKEQLWNGYKEYLIKIKDVGKDSDGDVAKSTIDEIIKHLKNANLLFNTPEKMVLGEKRQIVLLMSTKLPLPTLKIELITKITDTEKTGKIHEASIKATKKMESHLTGFGFTIKPITEIAQLVREDSSTRWEWIVKADEPGTQTLYLTVNAFINYAGEQTTQTIQTFRREILIFVEPTTAFWNWLDRHIAWVATSICAMVTLFLGYYLAVLKERRKTNTKTKPQ
ncbi:MAG: PEGA domain-containing protein [Deltaproteobacteria bacterium]|nr:PEGA domain-containing protein [Deltaproteobacteria bacterium]